MNLLGANYKISVCKKSLDGSSAKKKTQLFGECRSLKRGRFINTVINIILATMNVTILPGTSSLRPSTCFAILRRLLKLIKFLKSRKTNRISIPKTLLKNNACGDRAFLREHFDLFVSYCSTSPRRV